MKTLSVAPLAAGAIVLCGVLSSFEASAGSPGTVPPGEPRTLDLTAVPMTISQPGTYLVRRNWDLTYSNTGGAPGITAITIIADNVVIDFQGYQVKFAEYGTGVKIKGGGVTLRGGSLLGGVFSYAVRSSGAATVIDRMSIYSYMGLDFSGQGTQVRDSNLDARGSTVRVVNNAVVERNYIHCYAGCVYLGNDSSFVHNRVDVYVDDAVHVVGNGNVLADNIIEGSASPGVNYAFSLTGNGNTLLRNTVKVADLGAAIIVDGTANVLDANVAFPGPGDRPTASGITFKQSGNFYGNNRMSAQIPFDNGGAQTDWGGNVGF